MNKVGARWSKEEDSRLVEEYNICATTCKAYGGEINLDEIAKMHGRTKVAIVYRLHKLGIIAENIYTSSYKNGHLPFNHARKSYLHPEFNDTINKNHNLSKDNGAKKIYVLKMYSSTSVKESKYYVGVTTDVDKRFEEHKSREGGAEWTKYCDLDIIEILETFDMKSPFDEDMKVKEMMLKYGIDNVRGGTYSQCTLSPEQIHLLNREINHATGACLQCGSPDHWINECYYNSTTMS